MRRRLTVVMDITSRCNLRCVMCHFSEVDQIDFKPHGRPLTTDGSIPVDLFERVARDLFPRAGRVALGCAAEPLMHPRFSDLLAIAARHNVPQLWFPTNLLPLTEAKAEAICAARVHTVAVSVDAFTRDRYESIRVGASWDRLLTRLDLLNTVRRAHATRPRLRVIFTWMRSNRGELRSLPAFAEAHDADEIDVRFVVPAPHVDNASESLADEDPARLGDELCEVAEEAVGRGLVLSSYPEFELLRPRRYTLAARLKRRAWRFRAGIDHAERWMFGLREWRHGCAYPGTTYVVRPNGAIAPCTFWEDQPLGIYPQEDLRRLESGDRLREIREGLKRDEPVGSCHGCSVRRRAFQVLALRPTPML